MNNDDSCFSEKTNQSQNKCPEITECPYKAEKCSDDDDCNPDSFCCKSPCGNVCTKQLQTGNVLHIITISTITYKSNIPITDKSIGILILFTKYAAILEQKVLRVQNRNT